MVYPTPPRPLFLPRDEDVNRSEQDRWAELVRAQVVRSIAYELSTPLTPLAGYLRILRSEKLGALNPDQRKLVESMAQSVDRLASMVDGLSDFASFSSGVAPVPFAEEFDLGESLDRVIEHARLSAAKAKHVHISLRGQLSGTKLYADPSRFSQALWYLLENAIAATPAGGEVLVEAAVEAGGLKISVYDQGEPLPLDELSRVFEPFYRPHRGSPRTAVGLGLPLARKIAEAHGGELSVESPPVLQPGIEHLFGGAKYILRLPMG